MKTLDDETKQAIVALIEKTMEDYEWEDPKTKELEDKQKTIANSVLTLDSALVEFKKELVAINAAKPRETVVKMVSERPVKVAKKFKLTHRQMPEILKLVTCRASGYPMPVWVWGAPGAGKTVMMEQIAESIGITFMPLIMSPTMTDSKVIGFNSAAQGQYVMAIGREWYAKGGLLYVGEIDNAEPGTLVSLNTLVGNDTYRFPDGKRLKKHKDCYIVADGNTLGTGASNWFRRQSQDAAVRDRWFKYRLEYDETLEAAIAPVKSWVDYVQKVRACVSRMAQTNVWITPRSSLFGAAALQNGIPAKVVMEHLLCEFSTSGRQQVLSECGEYKSN